MSAIKPATRGKSSALLAAFLAADREGTGMRKRFAGWLQSRPLWQYALIVAAFSFPMMFILSWAFWEAIGRSGARPLDQAIVFTIVQTILQTWMRSDRQRIDPGTESHDDKPKTRS